jgi:hypothetical protein
MKQSYKIKELIKENEKLREEKNHYYFAYMDQQHLNKEYIKDITKIHLMLDRISHDEKRLISETIELNLAERIFLIISKLQSKIIKDNQ